MDMMHSASTEEFMRMARLKRKPIKKDEFLPFCYGLVEEKIEEMHPLATEEFIRMCGVLCL